MPKWLIREEWDGRYFRRIWEIAFFVLLVVVTWEAFGFVGVWIERAARLGQ